jgi:hypothetical protein
MSLSKSIAAEAKAESEKAKIVSYSPGYERKSIFGDMDNG